MFYIDHEPYIPCRDFGCQVSSQVFFILFSSACYHWI